MFGYLFQLKCFIKMDDFQLITLVENNEILYDKTRSDYKDKNKQNNAWQKIADSMALEVEYVKSRWLCLRQRFSRERIKMASSTEATNEWELLKYMRFLDGVVKRRRIFKKTKLVECSRVQSGTNCNATSQVVQPLVFVDVAASDDESIVGSDSCGTISRTSGEMFSPSAETLSPRSSISKDDVDIKPKKRPSSPMYSTEEPPKKQILNTLQTNLRETNTLIAKKPFSTADSDDIFGQYVASRLKLMDDAEKKEKIKDIFNILMS